MSIVMLECQLPWCLHVENIVKVESCLEVETYPVSRSSSLIDTQHTVTHTAESTRIVTFSSRLWWFAVIPHACFTSPHLWVMWGVRCGECVPPTTSLRHSRRGGGRAVVLHQQPPYRDDSAIDAAKQESLWSAERLPLHMPSSSHALLAVCVCVCVFVCVRLCVCFFCE